MLLIHDFLFWEVISVVSRAFVIEFLKCIESSEHL